MVFAPPAAARAATPEARSPSTRGAGARGGRKIDTDRRTSRFRRARFRTINAPMHFARVLLVNAASQVFASSLLGFVMLLPLQPWAPAFIRRLPPTRALMPIHLDLYMLAFMQALAALAMIHVGVPSLGGLATALLVFGGWANTLPYVFRLFKINAFVLAPGGGARQWLAAGISGLSSLGIVVAWGILVASWIAGD